MNKIVNKFLLAADKSVPEIHLKQPGFTYSACGPFTKKQKKNTKIKKTGDTNYIYKNELDKACFQHDMAYADIKDLLEKQFLITSWETKHIILQKILKMMVIKEVLLLWFINVLIKNLLLVVVSLKIGELHKSIIRKCKKRKVYLSYKSNICGADLYAIK